MSHDQSVSQTVAGAAAPTAAKASRRPRPRIARRAALLGLIAAVPYLAVAGRMQCAYEQSTYPYHVLAADALIHGQLYLRDEAFRDHVRRVAPQFRQSIEAQLRARGETLDANTIQEVVYLKAVHDLAVVGNRLYTYWPPLASVVMVPWVLLFGPGVSDRLVNALFGALNVALAYWMFRSVDRSGLRRISEPCCVALAVLLGFGTVHFFLSCGGRIWFAAQITTTTALLLSIIVLARGPDSARTYALCGALFGAAILGRNTVLLAGLFYPIVIWLRQRNEKGDRLRRFAMRVTAFGLPVILAGILNLAYNYARFGSIFETGQGIAVHTGGAPRFVEDYDRHGTFNLVYLPTNLKYYLWNWRFPVQNGRRMGDLEGNSMFLVTPPLLYLFLIRRRWDGFTVALLFGALPVVAALLLFRATGFSQFGNRYLLDAMPFLLLLVATGMKGRLSFPAFVLIVAAVAMNAFGTAGFYRGLIGPWADWFTPLPLAAAATIAVLIGAAVWVRRDPDPLPT
ncbi:MAG TPA: hypothetical protein PLC79_00160 [Phycisphaerae bacterium]|nr:hypothetical protein [Phycisphaerae bacterium]